MVQNQEKDLHYVNSPMCRPSHAPGWNSEVTTYTTSHLCIDVLNRLGQLLPTNEEQWQIFGSESFTRWLLGAPVDTRLMF